MVAHHVHFLGSLVAIERQAAASTLHDDCGA